MVLGTHMNVAVTREQILDNVRVTFPLLHNDPTPGELHFTITISYREGEGYTAYVLSGRARKRKPFIAGAAAPSVNEAYDSLLKATSEVVHELTSFKFDRPNPNKLDCIEMFQGSRELSMGVIYNAEPSRGLKNEAEASRTPGVEPNQRATTAGFGPGVAEGIMKSRFALGSAPVTHTFLPRNGRHYPSPYEPAFPRLDQMDPYLQTFGPVDPYFQQFDPRSRSRRPGN